MLNLDEVINVFYNENNLDNNYLLYNYLSENNYLNPSKQVRNLILFIHSYYINFNMYLTEFQIYTLLCNYCADKRKSLIRK